MNTLKLSFVKDWRTTANGLLSATIAVIVAVMVLPPGQRKVVYVLAGLRALVGFVQQDAGKQLAIPYGGKTPEIMDSHEQPNQPGATPVLK